MLAANILGPELGFFASFSTKVQLTVCVRED
jgi:hypothetical protein